MPEATTTRWPPARLNPTGVAKTSDGVSVAYYDLGGSGPPLLLLHATGFCGPVLAPMANHLRDGFRCIAIDCRGHGCSTTPLSGDFAWSGFGDDALAVVDQLGLERPYGLGHSCGGAALILSEASRPGTFGGLYCYEPVIYPSDNLLPANLDDNPLSAGARRRRRNFAGRNEALENFSAKPPFDRLHPEVLAAYVDNGFEPDPAGGIRLRCRREREAQIYAQGFAHDAYARLGAIRCPVTLACGEKTDAIGPEFLALFAARLRRVEQVVLPDLGHFGPLEDPTAVASSLRTSLAAAVPPAMWQAEEDGQ
ncbi:MAG: alpha/beta fold hydrolase [Acidimicrobiales bacterium]